MSTAWHLQMDCMGFRSLYLFLYCMQSSTLVKACSPLFEEIGTVDKLSVRNPDEREREQVIEVVESLRNCHN